MYQDSWKHSEYLLCFVKTEDIFDFTPGVVLKPEEEKISHEDRANG